MRNILILLLLLAVYHTSAASKTDTAALRRYVLELCDTTHGYRHGGDTARLNRAARSIRLALRQYADSAVDMSYRLADGREYANLIASYGPRDAPRIIVGAHYDVCGEQQGADDNTSGVAGLLELARMLQPIDKADWKYRIDLVAFTLEEPPYFRTPAMGSSVHAHSLAANRIPVRGMISLEMIGYFRDERGSQSYPIGILKLIYGRRGNFITSVHQLHKGAFVRQVQRAMKRAGTVRVKKFGAPRAVPGIDFSDHQNYWDQDWPAMMITDTSFFRNRNYHARGDTPETLDYRRMAGGVDAVLVALLAQQR